MSDLDILTKTVLNIIQSWIETKERACVENGLTLDKLIQAKNLGEELPIEYIYEGIIKTSYDNFEIVCRELRYKNQIIARMSRKNAVYKFEGFILKKSGGNNE